MKRTPDDPALTEVYRPARHGELALIKARLDAAGIRYHVKNELATLGSLAAVGSEQLIVMVETVRAAEARRIVEEVVG